MLAAAGAGMAILYQEMIYFDQSIAGKTSS
jgi:hypothetical protein